MQTLYFKLAPLQTIICTEIEKKPYKFGTVSNYTSKLKIIAAEKQCKEFCS